MLQQAAVDRHSCRGLQWPNCRIPDNTAGAVANDVRSELVGVKQADALPNALGAFGGRSGTKKWNESDAGHRIAVTQNGHADPVAPPDVPLRPEAIHTATALETGETEISTSDRHLLAALAHFRPRPAQCLSASLKFDNLRGVRLARDMCIDPQRAELIREELGRIMASDLFCRSDRLCRFLRFSVGMPCAANQIE